MRTILGAFNSEYLDVGTTPVRLRGVSTTRPNGERLSLLVTAGGDLFIGGKDVTTATGKPMSAGKELAFDAAGGLYAIASVATTIHLLEAF